MSILSDADLAQLRAIDEGEMVDTCLITKPGEGKGPWNSSTGTYDPPAPVPVYGPDLGPCFGKCALKAPAVVNPFQADGAVETWQVEQLVLSLPVVGSEGVAAGMTVTYLTAVHDTALVDRVFGIVGPHHETAATSRRLLVNEVTGVGA